MIASALKPANAASRRAASVRPNATAIVAPEKGCEPIGGGGTQEELRRALNGDRGARQIRRIESRYLQCELRGANPSVLELLELFPRAVCPGQPT